MATVPARHVAAPLLEVSGLLFFWLGCVLSLVGPLRPAEAAWAVGAGIASGAAGVYLRLGRNASRTHSGDVAGRVPERGRYRATDLVALACFTALSAASAWIGYASGSSGPLSHIPVLSVVGTYGLWLLPFLGGLWMGALPGAWACHKTVFLIAWLAVIKAGVHWAAVRSGLSADWTTAEGAMAVGYLSFLATLPLALLGCLSGRTIARPTLRSRRRSSP